MKIISLILTSAAFAFQNASAQSFQPTVVGSAGTFATSASGSMSWTIGEVMTETYSPAGNFFTQGFHQPPDNFIVIAVSDPSVETISIYPNPVASNLIIDFSSAIGNYSICIYDMLGNVLRKENVSANQKQLNIPFLQFADGVYLLDIVNSASNSRSSYKINKTEYK